ncbi:MAG: ABC transporter permease [Lachnospiraceae bacterium]|nr:ABC transporter permease [Lachnospiraceae bacterium]
MKQKENRNYKKARHKKTITNLALSNNKKNRSRSVLIILSIFLSTMLLTMIAEFGYGMIQHNRLNAGTFCGNYCAVFNRAGEEQYETICRRSEFVHVGRSAYVGEVNCDEAKAGLLWMDEESAKNNNIYGKIEGRLPEKENELVASLAFFEKMGVLKPEIGKSVTVPFRRDNQSKFAEKEFVISGILDSGQSNDFQKTYQGYVSRAFYESVFPEEMRRCSVTFRLNDSLKVNGNNVEETIQELGALCGIEEKNVSLNSMYLMWMYDPGTETILGCVGISLIVILVSIVVIFNIFQVGIVQKIQEYGKLKALGATRRQLKQVIFREGMTLAAAGIPLGLAGGSLLAELLFYNFIVTGEKAVGQVGMVRVSVLSFPILLLAAAVSFLTVWISLKKPMRIVASISPIEAVRYQENSRQKKAVRQGSRQVSVLRITFSNLWANKRRTLRTIFTMGLSCVLFVALANLAGNMDREHEVRSMIEHGQFLIELDCSLRDEAYPENNLDEVQKDNPLGREFQEELEAIPGVTRVDVRYLFAAELKNASAQNEGRDITSICALNREEFERYGANSSVGNVDYDEVAAEDGLLYGASYFLEESGYTLGEKVQAELQDGGNKVPLEGKMMGAFGVAPAAWVMTEDTYRKLKLEGELEGQLWVTCEESEKIQVEAAIRELMSGKSHMALKTYDEAKKQVDFQIQSMQICIYAFLGVIGLISFMNMANTIITGVVTRKKELGILQAVGMTNRQLNQMLQLEGMLFSAGTIVIALAAGSPMGYGIFRYAKEKGFVGLDVYHVPLLEIGAMIGAIVLLQVMLSWILSRNLRKESLVERINYQN